MIQVTTSCRSLLSAWILLAVFQPAWAADQEHDLWHTAEARIAKYRQAETSVVVVDQAGDPVPQAQVSIEQKRHAFLFGCNFFKFGTFEDPDEEQAYRQQFADLFNFATLPFYWASYERERGQPRHASTEQAARWCREHGIRPKGHPLAWNYSDPAWLPDDAATIRQLQLERITDCVTRFRGFIDIWDVVNEATHFERDAFVKQAPKMTRMWEETGRLKFVDQCFAAARAANPNATFLINDYRTDPAYVKLIQQMAKPSGRRAYDVIGIQSHMHGGVWSNEKIWEVCERFASFDVPLHFTELTVLSGALSHQRADRNANWASTPEAERQQAEEVRRIYTMLFSHPDVQAITWWDFADRGAWQQAPAGLVGQDLQPKPAYLALKQLIKQRWWTRKTSETNNQGQVSFRGFLGDYRITVTADSGQTTAAPLTISAHQPNQLEVVLD